MRFPIPIFVSVMPNPRKQIIFPSPAKIGKPRYGSHFMAALRKEKLFLTISHNPQQNHQLLSREASHHLCMGNMVTRPRYQRHVSIKPCFNTTCINMY
jgi:hypothetical protein